jgi:hypothetical protein
VLLSCKQCCSSPFCTPHGAGAGVARSPAAFGVVLGEQMCHPCTR